MKNFCWKGRIVINTGQMLITSFLFVNIRDQSARLSWSWRISRMLVEYGLVRSRPPARTPSIIVIDRRRMLEGGQDPMVTFPSNDWRKIWECFNRLTCCQICARRNTLSFSKAQSGDAAVWVSILLSVGAARRYPYRNATQHDGGSRRRRVAMVGTQDSRDVTAPTSGLATRFWPRRHSAEALPSWGGESDSTSIAGRRRRRWSAKKQDGEAQIQAGSASRLTNVRAQEIDCLQCIFVLNAPNAMRSSRDWNCTEILYRWWRWEMGVTLKIADERASGAASPQLFFLIRLSDRVKRIAEAWRYSRGVFLFFGIDVKKRLTNMLPGEKPSEPSSPISRIAHRMGKSRRTTRKTSRVESVESRRISTGWRKAFCQPKPRPDRGPQVLHKRTNRPCGLPSLLVIFRRPSSSLASFICLSLHQSSSEPSVS